MGHAFLSAVGQAWPPFVLVVGLLLIGAVVEADGLFLALGTRIERVGGGPITLLATLLGHLGPTGDAIVGAVASVLINNLPAATLLSAEKPEHPLPLLIGLNLGPNLLFTGSLSAFLWYQAARRTETQPSLTLAALLGLGLVPLTIAVALAALSVTS